MVLRTRGAATAAFVAVLAIASPALAAPVVDTSAIRGQVEGSQVNTHLQALQAVADANGGTRAAGTPGYEASLEYVEEQLAAYPNYFDVRRDEFEFDKFRVIGEPTFSSNTKTYELGDYYPMDYSGSGTLTNATVVPTNDFVLPPVGGSSSGCELGDFPVPPNTNSVALIQRGSCDFAVKALNAETAGYKGAIIFNEGNEVPDDDRIGLLFGTLGDGRPSIPVIGTTHAVGIELNQPGTTVSLDLQTQIVDNLKTWNLIAETKTGRTDRTVVSGAHLDSVDEGPGINDNGSGSAGNLEMALEMAENNMTPRNRVRFAWFGAEEAGLVGSQAYVDELSATPREIKNIAVMLNYDMIGSPNFARFVYDGDGSDTASTASTGSGIVESVFTSYFDAAGLAHEPTAFDGRSDYDAFVAAGIPAGGLFTGAEGIKTEEQFGLYGGTAGVAYDPCYHAACDTIDNVSAEALDQMSDAAAHGVWTFAQTTSAIEGTGKGKTNGTHDSEYLGSLLKK